MNDNNGQSGHERCGGRTRAGTLCKLPAGHGTDHPGVGRCDHHCGATPTHRAHAERVLLDRAEESALAELGRIGVEPVGNPLEALAELAGEARQWERILRRQVAELESLSQMTPAGVEQVRQVVILFERAMDRAVAFAALCARLDVDERIFRLNERLAEAQGRQAFEVYQAGLALLDLEPRQWQLAREGYPRVLRALVTEVTDD